MLVHVIDAVLMRCALLVSCLFVASCANVECTLNSDCGDHARCDMNRCVRDCVQDRDCAKGERCSLNGVCVSGAPTDDRPSPEDAVEIDAAPDVVSTPDAPVAPDTSRPDVIVAPDVPVPVDQLAPDVPVVDAVAPDVPVVDVAPRDAPVIDVAPMDVAPVDVTVMDVAPMDVAPVDVTVTDVAPMDAPRDTGSADVTLGPVGVGVYEYTGVRPGALVAPVAVAWHPSGSYALILSASNTVFRFEPSTMAVTQVATTAADVSWRSVSFLADGSSAILIGNTITSSTARRGRLFVWSHAASTLAERTSEQWTMGSYESLRWNRDGSRGALLGRANTYLSVWFYGPDGARVGSPIAYGRVMNTGCNDLGWITDGFGDPALSIACGVNTAEILLATDLTGTARFSTAVAPGAVSNVNSIAVRPQGDLALVVDGTSRLGRYRDFLWTTGFSTPTLTGASSVVFFSDGARALAYGGFGRVHEYRYDLYTSTDIVNVSISNLAMAPFTQPSNAMLNAMAWRPGCEEGLAVGGANSSSGTSAFVAVFRVTNGRRCP